ncbi:aspartate aminotransferase, cytoplasmic-like [Oratosquilla oratoria]|uniref:aspartate aminotransferase, cytoplasmic-like n=1 Tax=Oratosquilla oratoria TaxID=337810 RepID=UPI003F764E9E
MSSFFHEVQQPPAIEVFAVAKAFNEDTHKKKVHLSAIGAYRTNDSKPWVLPVVRRVEKEMAEDDTLNHEYLPILGFEPLATAASRILLGADNPLLKEGRVTGVQVLSGTGGLRVAADFLGKILKFDTVIYSNPTWGSHYYIFHHSGFKELKTYRYWDKSTKGLNIDGMLEDIRSAPYKSVIILHACAHNPTGVDPTQEQWKLIADAVEEKHHFPLFDCAYQGLASGDLEKDAWAVRYFAERGFEMIVTQSFAKNLGLYNDRIGNLMMIVKDPAVITPIRSQLTLLVRGAYSAPPNHGAPIVTRILSDDALFAEWKGAIRTMSDRIKEMRAGLKERLIKLGTPGTWEHITDQFGMFSFTGLSAEQVKYLAEKYHVYMMSNGQVNICGLTTHNLDYVAKAIHDTVTSMPKASL